MEKKKYKHYGKSGVLKYQTYVHVMAHLNRVPIHHCVQINSHPKVIAAPALHMLTQSPSPKGVCGRDVNLRHKATNGDKQVNTDKDVPVTRQFPVIEMLPFALCQDALVQPFLELPQPMWGVVIPHRPKATLSHMKPIQI